MIYSVIKTTFKSEEQKKSYRDYSNFSSECLKDDFMSSICQEKNDYLDFGKKIVGTLNKYRHQRKLRYFEAIKSLI